MPNTTGAGGAETKRTQLLPTRNPPKQTFNVMGRAVREIHVMTLWLQISGVHNNLRAGVGRPKTSKRRGLSWLLQDDQRMAHHALGGTVGSKETTLGRDSSLFAAR